MPRQRHPRVLKKKVLIFCEGETEVLYFKMLNQKYKANLNVDIQLSCRNGKQGLTIIKDLIQQQKTNPQFKKEKYDLIFAVFDKDNLPESNIIQAYQLADKNNITIIFSNECFDLWLLKHYEKVTGFKSRDAIYKRLTTLLKLQTKYENFKADKDFVDTYFYDHVHVAVGNTIHIPEQQVLNTIPNNPYTNIHIFLEVIYSRNNTSSGW